MGYKVRFQTDYPNNMYGTGTVYDSACGPSSLVNALLNAGIADAGILDMCRFAVNAGARIPNVGTDMSVLIKAAARQYGFEYKATSLNAELKAHLQAGGTAIMNQGSSYPVFSTGGHFVSAIDISGNMVTVADSYWNTTKYKTWPTHHSLCTVVQKGIVQCSIETCGKATIDRVPSYYLISKVDPTVTTTDSVTARTGAGKANAAVGTIDKGATLTVLDNTTNWIQTAVWIAKKYCTISGSKAKLTADVNARASNGTSSAKLGTLNKGVSLVVLEQTENWVKVPVWVAKKYTK